jgi:hypothetical protein
VAGVTVGSRNTCYRAARYGLTRTGLAPVGLHQLLLAPSEIRAKSRWRELTILLSPEAPKVWSRGSAASEAPARPIPSQTIGTRVGCAPRRLRRPLPEPVSRRHRANAGDGVFRLTVRSGIPASGHFATRCSPALPCNPASFSLLFA